MLSRQGAAAPASCDHPCLLLTLLSGKDDKQTQKPKAFALLDLPAFNQFSE